MSSSDFVPQADLPVLRKGQKVKKLRTLRKIAALEWIKQANDHPEMLEEAFAACVAMKSLAKGFHRLGLNCDLILKWVYADEGRVALLELTEGKIKQARRYFLEDAVLDWIDYDPSKAFDDKGNWLGVRGMPSTLRKCIQQIQTDSVTVKVNEPVIVDGAPMLDGNGNPVMAEKAEIRTRVTGVKFIDKTRAADMLGSWFGLKKEEKAAEGAAFGEAMMKAVEDRRRLMAEQQEAQS